VYNPTEWQNDLFERKLRQASSAFNENARSRLLNEAQAIAYEEAPWIWLWRQYAFYGTDSELDWTPRRDGLVNLYKSEGDSTGTQ
jgi:peptide/nickel transport system substrate-binding protein